MSRRNSLISPPERDDSWRHQERTSEICGHLATMARQAGPGGRLPRVVELCERLKVSPRTLDKALGELEARDIVSRQRGIGLFAGPRARRSLVVLVSFHLLRSAQHSPFWDILLERIAAYKSQSQENVSLRILTPGEFEAPPADIVQKYRSAEIDGVIGIGLEAAMTQWILNSGIPFVAFAGYARHVVQIDEITLLRTGLNALVERGCRYIGLGIARGQHLQAQKSDAGIQDKIQLFRTILETQGLEFNPDWVEDGERLIGASGDRVQLSSQQQGFEWIKRLKSQGDLPDGLLVFDDLMTTGVLTALHSFGVRVGRDILVASHANRGVPVFLGDSDQVIRLEIAPDEIVHALFEMMEGRLAESPVETLHSVTPHLVTP